MPKEITHWILAEKAYQGINADSVLKPIIHRCKNLYMAGAVVMDTPFYQIFGKNGKNMNRFGHKIHDNPVNSYEPLVKVINSFSPDIPDDLLSFLLGVISHIHADSSFHPFVYYFSGTSASGPEKDRKRATFLHRTLEAYMDLYYSAEFQLQNKGLFSETLDNMEIEEKRFLKFMALFFSETKISTMKKAVRIHAVIQKFFYNNLVKIILKALNSIPSVELEHHIASFYPSCKPDPKLMFVYPFSYKDPVTGESFQSSARELEERAVRNILQIFSQIEYHIKNSSFAKGLSELRGPNLYTGAVGNLESDMYYFSAEKNLMKLIFGDSDNHY
ncbi:MAG: zinc dependent phospholipase C family protein [Desulfobacterales bacterium]|nr:zinc dependent phospholipase C family protein [Desulfobacterales bacterium]